MFYLSKFSFSFIFIFLYCILFMLLLLLYSWSSYYFILAPLTYFILLILVLLYSWSSYWKSKCVLWWLRDSPLDIYVPVAISLQTSIQTNLFRHIWWNCKFRIMSEKLGEKKLGTQRGPNISIYSNYINADLPLI